MDSKVHLVVQRTDDVEGGPGPLETWGDLGNGAVPYQGYWVNLFREDGDLIPWSESGNSVNTAYFTAEEEGCIEWYVHLGAGLPGIFELARFDDPETPDIPTEVQQFEFTDRVIGPLPRIVWPSKFDGTPPATAWRFWPGKYAELIPG